MRVARALESKAERQAYGLEPTDNAALLFKDVAAKWEAQLVNRSASDDRSRLRNHLLPRFGSTPLSAITVQVIMLYLDELRAAKQIASGTQRHLLGILSRVFSFCLERGYAQSNPCRMISPGKRPKLAARRDGKWLADDAVVVQIFELLPEPFRYLFFLGNRSGVRTGEACGLRMSDLDDVAAGVIRVRYSYNGWTKESKASQKTKHVPAPVDAVEVLGPWLERRRIDGAQVEDLAFPGKDGRVLRKENVAYPWNRVADQLGINLTWYDCTRRSFVSRNAALGVPLDEISAAVGHASSATTSRFYNCYVRTSYSALMRGGLGLGTAAAGNMVALDGARAAAPATSQTAAETSESENLDLEVGHGS
jgi:integrase